MIRRLRSLRSAGILLVLALLCSSVALAAWPLTRLTTYVANSTPVIKAADLNAVQDAFGTVLTGGWTFKGIKLDGTGGNAATPPAGSIVISRTVSGTTLPNTALLAGELPKGLVPLCWAQVKSDGSGIYRGVNILAVGRYPAGAATGDYYVDCNAAPADLNNTAPIATSFGSTPLALSAGTGDNGGGKIRTRVQVAGSADVIFNLVVFGE